jgi:uncharacterized protein
MSLKAFENQQYLNIETFRKNGQGVKTPVWFAQDGDLLLVWTESSSGKAKRIRNNDQVKVAPSRGDGTPLDEWLVAQAVADDSPEALAHVKKLMGKKYGFTFSLFGLLGKFRQAQYTTVKVKLKN